LLNLTHITRAARLRLYRQAQILARHVAGIERSALANRVGRACRWLEPSPARLAAYVFAPSKLFADDT
jgi:transposase